MKPGHLLMPRSDISFFGPEMFSATKESLAKSSFLIDDLLRSQSRKTPNDQTSDGAETISTPSPTNTPFLSSSHPIIQPTSVGSFNIDALAMPTHPSTRPQHPFHLSSFPYPYNLHSLLKFSMSLPAHNPVFGRDMMSIPPYMPYPSLDMSFLLRDRLLQLTDGNGTRKCRRSRTVFSELQLAALEKRFECQKYLSTPDRMELAEALGLTQLQVKTWYQNRRMKWKKQVQPSESSNELEQAVLITKSPISEDNERTHRLQMGQSGQDASSLHLSASASHSPDSETLLIEKEHDRGEKVSVDRVNEVVGSYSFLHPGSSVRNLPGK